MQPVQPPQPLAAAVVEGRVKPTISKYFTLCGTLQFTKASDVCKQKTSVTLGQPWTKLLSPLLLLATSESIYYSLAYLESRWIGKDHLTNMYRQVFADLTNALKIFKTFATPEDELSFFTTLIVQTGLLVGLRKELVSLYRNMATSRGNPDYKELVTTLSNIRKQISLGIAHPFLETVKNNFFVEVGTLYKLLLAQGELSNYNLKDSVVLLYKAKNDLDEWKNCIGDKSESSFTKTGIIGWLSKLHAVLHSKMTFYFYPILSKSEIAKGDDIKNWTTKLEINYFALISDFVQKAQCYHVSLIFDEAGCQQTEPVASNSTTVNFGYDCSKPLNPTKSGLASWPAIVSYPQESGPLEHWPNVVSLIMDNPEQLNKYKEPLFCFDAHAHASYFFSKIDPRVWLVVIYNKKKNKNDVFTQEFMYIMTTNLRNWKIFSLLKPKDK